MRNYRLYFLVFVAIFLVVSCSEFDDFDGPIETNRELALPLFHSTTTLVDLLDGFNEETFVTLGPDDLITLNYKGNVAERDADFFFSFLQDIPIGLTDSVTLFPFDIPGTLDVTLMNVKSGILTLLVKNTFDEKVDVTVTIPQLIKDGEIFSKNKVLDSVSVSTLPWFQPYDITGYDLVGSGDNLKIIYEAYLESTGERVIFDTDPVIGIQGLKFSYVEGFWGTEILDLARDTIEIEFFESWVQGDVFFEDPKIEVNVKNSFGFPVRSQVNLMDILIVNGDVISLESPFIDNGIDFEYPLLSEVGVSKTTTFDFDNTNSNIVDVLSSGPVNVDYDVDAVSNPDSLQVLGFMTDSSNFQVQLEVELPFRGHVNNFTAQDVFDVNFDSYDDVKFIEFKMVGENEIPLGIDVQVYFTDKNQFVIDSLYTGTQNILSAAPVDNNGEATGVISESITYTTIDAAKFNKIKAAKKLIVVGTFFTTDVNSANPTVVSIKGDQEVNIRMGMKVGLN